MIEPSPEFVMHVQCCCSKSALACQAIAPSFGCSPPSAGMAKYFFATTCPAAEDCSSQAWKRSQCWGQSAEECKSQVIRHLMTSGLHNMSRDDAESLAEITPIDEGAYEELPAKRHKRSSGDAFTEQPQERPVIGRKQLPQLQQVPAMGFSSVGSDSSSVVPAASSGYVNMRVHEFQAAIDCVSRAVHSAQQAQRLAAAAARAFGDEVVALSEVKTNLETIKIGMQ